ncbi:MAG: acetyl/propionyl/methylcrotonyl-CoA carboxylase subunit alpha [Legionellales bacterium]|nr:acetyl/propionyl/methylcrotonyl-CoA carboxylase subunit alpha [Legionellales bacterium]
MTNIQKILIANRGEIACRIIKTAKRLGIRTVAVYSSADHHAKHVSLADEAYWIGNAPSQESYLNSEKIIAIAELAKADAIHPGYGFLSENTHFAEQLTQAGLIFIGPSTRSIQAMGSKAEAKKIMEKAQVPLVPGYHGDNQDPQFLAKQAEKIGFPVLLKAASGGGGKGMRIVYQAAGFQDALTSAKREALKSFGDDHIILEKYIEHPRHVEIQIFADTQGNVIHLCERDCSTQRRYQKVIEEAPAPHFPAALREKMGQAAIQAARAIHYTGAGTVEFLLASSGEFYFMEMNTRLQVEHPVTEKILNIDLVEWQILIAEGKPLPLSQAEIQPQGHAFEARIYAEDPEHDFLPSTGTITYLNLPNENQHIRIDAGVTTNDTISIFYDPMIAKLIVWDTHREKALRQLQEALAKTHIIGVKTNISFLRQLALHPVMKAGKITTHFIGEHANELLLQNTSQHFPAIILACLIKLFQTKPTQSPWGTLDAWQMNLPATYQWTIKLNSEIITIHAIRHHSNWQFKHADIIYNVKNIKIDNDCVQAEINYQRYQLHYLLDTHTIHLLSPSLQLEIAFHDADLATHDGLEENNLLISPMPGAVIAIMVKPGQTVSSGDPLLIMEAMKMEHTICAPHDGIITDIFYQVGDQVNEGMELLRLEEIPA